MLDLWHTVHFYQKLTEMKAAWPPSNDSIHMHTHTVFWTNVTSCHNFWWALQFYLSKTSIYWEFNTFWYPKIKIKIIIGIQIQFCNLVFFSFSKFEWTEIKWPTQPSFLRVFTVLALRPMSSKASQFWASWNYWSP